MRTNPIWDIERLADVSIWMKADFDAVWIDADWNGMDSNSRSISDQISGRVEAAYREVRRQVTESVGYVVRDFMEDITAAGRVE